MGKAFRFEYRVTLIYLLLGVLWITLSDKLVEMLLSDPEKINNLQTYKGVFFILLTAWLLFSLIKGHLKRLKKAERIIQQEMDEIERLNSVLQQQNQELMLSKQKAEENSRLKSSFLQNISHEVRTPMNAIMGFSGLIAEPDLTKEKRMHYANIIEGSCNQLLSIINDVLTMSSIVTNQEKEIRSVFQLNQLMDELADRIKSSLSDEIRFKLSLGMEDENSTVCMDKDKLFQILGNLLNNAAKFTKKGSIELGYRVENEELVFYVKDTGIGIPEEKQRLIFEQFRQAQESTTKEYGGTGLGLAICKSFTELMGGRILLESEIKKGSTFCVCLPFTPTVEASQNKAQDSEKTCSILVAEDEPWNFHYLETVLKKTNVRLYWAENGVEAVDMLLKKPDIELILMDIKMPILDGYQAALQIRNLRPEIPIIAQTAYAMEDERELYGSAFDAYLTKPLSAKAIRQTVAQFLEGRKV